MKNLIRYLLTCTLLCLTILISYYFKLQSFSSERVIKDIEFLSSDNLNGRLTGSLDNEIAAAFVKEAFESTGLLPYQGSYSHSFSVDYPHSLQAEPELLVINNQEPVKAYVYGKDYKEDLLNFRNSQFVFSREDVKYNENAITIDNSQGKIVFFKSEQNDFNFRSSFIKEAYYDMYIAISSETHTSILDELKKGSLISLSIPYRIETTVADNITAIHMGSGKDNEKLIVSSHFDHIGADLMGRIYSGALDNASGTAFMLEIARYVKELGPSDKDIIFAAFNAEEFGCLGSKAFVEEHLEDIKYAKLYNFDMIGSSENLPLTIMGSSNDSAENKLISSLITSFEERSIDYLLSYEDSSDHQYFRKSGIEAVTLTHADISRIHTPYDTIEHISPEAIDEAFAAFKAILLSEAYGDNPFVYYNRQSLLLALALWAFLSLIYVNIFNGYDSYD